MDMSDHAAGQRFTVASPVRCRTRSQSVIIIAREEREDEMYAAVVVFQDYGCRRLLCCMHRARGHSQEREGYIAHTHTHTGERVAVAGAEHTQRASDQQKKRGSTRYPQALPMYEIQMYLMREAAAPERSCQALG